MRNLIAIMLLSCAGAAASANDAPPAAAIASAHPLATEAGMEVLAAGGNAFDAAITVASVLGVVEPYSAGIGGGGFWLLHRARDQHQVFVDARETAPAAAHRDLYLDATGDPRPRASLDGPLAAGIPGQAAAFVHLAEQYGKLPLSVTLKHAIELARDGFEIDAVYRAYAAYRMGVLRDFPQSAEIFLPRGLPIGRFKVVQADLADTLQRLADQGFGGFYRGATAHRMVAAVQRDGGIWTLEDLAGYRIIEREPLRFRYGPYRIVSAPPPSSGGVAIATMLNILALHPFAELGPLDQTHLLVEAMRRAYRDRAKHLGDPEFYPVPVAKLVSATHAQSLNADLSMSRASRSEGPAANAGNGQHTTHFSILDREGNRVSATLSINTPFGSAWVADGTGVLLNNEMDDFSSAPGVPNAYGLVGAEANAIAPGKRPLSSMTPSFVESEQGVAILGTPGGSRIITMVLLGMLEHMAGKSPEDWVSRPRFHHQYLPDVIQHEPGAFPATISAGLRARGHQLRPLGRSYGNMQAILWNQQAREVHAASDPRKLGLARTATE